MKTEEPIITNPTKMYVLLMLYERDMHGYDLITEFQRRLKKTLSPGQIYPLLKDMMNKGLVEFYEEYQGKRKRKVYRLTRKGRDACEEVVEKLKELFEILK
jgi:DNA-binding PadR family transcriptional regulator